MKHILKYRHFLFHHIIEKQKIQERKMRKMYLNANLNAISERTEYENNLPKSSLSTVQLEKQVSYLLIQYSYCFGNPENKILKI